MDALQKASHKLAEVMYSQVKDNAGGDEPKQGAKSGSEDEVLEAEVVDETK